MERAIIVMPNNQDKSLLNLPTELQLEILGFLRPKELKQVAYVSKAMNAMSHEPELWFTFIKEEERDSYRKKKIHSKKAFLSQADVSLVYTIKDEYFSDHPCYVKNYDYYEKINKAFRKAREDASRQESIVEEDHYSPITLYERINDIFGLAVKRLIQQAGNDPIKTRILLLHPEFNKYFSSLSRPAQAGVLGQVILKYPNNHLVVLSIFKNLIFKEVFLGEGIIELGIILSRLSSSPSVSVALWFLLDADFRTRFTSDQSDWMFILYEIVQQHDAIKLEIDFPHFKAQYRSKEARIALIDTCVKTLQKQIERSEQTQENSSTLSLH